MSKKYKIGIIGLGYVGLQLAVAFDDAPNTTVIGYDIDKNKIEKLNKGVDETNEIENTIINKCKIKFTSSDIDLYNLDAYIIAVPTPVNSNNTPNLGCIKSACKIISKYLNKGTLVSFESTVYPGITEDICIPILENQSKLIAGKDFYLGYSPERLSPGDKKHCLKNVKKIISGLNKQSLDAMYNIYSLILKKDLLYTVETIKIAEAAKLLENTQRDLLIAGINEISQLYKKLNINVHDVIKAAATKWNFSEVYPGLVGGHCIGVDPYYLLELGKHLNYEMPVISSARNTNESVIYQLKSTIVDNLSDIDNSQILILGFSYKENVPDIRNTKVYNLIRSFEKSGISCDVYDPIVDKEQVYKEYNIKIVNIDYTKKYDAIIILVNHNEFKNFFKDNYKALLKSSNSIIYEINNEKNKILLSNTNIKYFSLY